MYFDIFCRVVDNYGDIGVCWRLARQLASYPHNARVRLWVDDLNSFHRIQSDIDPQLATQTVNQVTICRWDETHTWPTPAVVIIEAFACELPEAYKAQISANHLWINLDYLSAESWVNDFHAVASPQQESQRKYFFFPGFDAKTGGLLREHELLHTRNQWLQDTDNKTQLWTKLGIDSALQAELLHGQRRLIVLFPYPDAPITGLLNALRVAEFTSLVISPLPFNTTQHALQSEHLALQTIPFVNQVEFDHLLWSSDLNIVRGEDSLVRAMWAAKPMIWQPYPQADHTHRRKLQAWLDRSPLNIAVHSLMYSWSDGQEQAFTQQMQSCLAPAMWHAWREQSLQWSNELARSDDLATRLIALCTKKLQTR